MLLAPQQEVVVSYLSYPKHRIHFEQSETGIELRIPPLLAVELYRSGILPQDPTKSFSVAISGERMGSFRIANFRYPLTGYHDSVMISLVPNRALPPSSVASGEASGSAPSGSSERT